MKRLFILLGIVSMLAACDNGDMEKENQVNPYPDGVYPFEVTGVSHTTVTNVFNHLVTWTPPADSGFSRVELEMFVICNDGDFMAYPVPSDSHFISEDYRNFVLEKNAFSFFTIAGTDKYVTIKCVDKFGNKSEGVKFEF